MSAASISRGGARHRAANQAGHRRPARAGTFGAGVLLLARLAVGVLVGVIAVAAVKENVRFRVFEAWLAGHVLSLGGSIRAGAVPGAPVIWLAIRAHRYLGLLVTPECTVAVLMVPFLLCTAWNVWRQSRIVRPLLALAVAIALLVVVNQLRLLVIAWLVIKMGANSGFYWGHTMAGSLITLFGVAIVFLCYAVLVAAGRKPN